MVLHAFQASWMDLSGCASGLAISACLTPENTDVGLFSQISLERKSRTASCVSLMLQLQFARCLMR